LLFITQNCVDDIWKGMRAKQAEPTLSGCVADAIDFCNSGLQYASFINVKATSTLCRICNQIFEVYNIKCDCVYMQFKINMG